MKLSVLETDVEPGIIIGQLHRQEEKIIENLEYHHLLALRCIYAEFYKLLWQDN
jgi:NADH:ubiquinone oxidoreductase subunit D